MNPQNGLKIKPFKHAHQNRHKDKELQVRADGDEKETRPPGSRPDPSRPRQHLAVYLKHIAGLEDLSALNHRKWRRLTALKGRP